MAELNKSNFTEEFHIDLHGSQIKLNRACHWAHRTYLNVIFFVFMQCI